MRHRPCRCIGDQADEWERTFNICWGGVYNCTRAFLPMLVASTAFGSLLLVTNAAAAVDTGGVVEQQVDLVGLVAVGNLAAKPLDLRPVGDIGDVRR
jgi:NAD(P)-dependent dehydrogenase (short-subunit alcohol dehydrogenase family)